MKEIAREAGIWGISLTMLAVGTGLLFVFTALIPSAEYGSGPATLFFLTELAGGGLLLAYILDGWDEWIARPPAPPPPPPDQAILVAQRRAEIAAFEAAPKIKRCAICHAIAPEHLEACPRCRSTNLILIRADIPG